MWEMISEMATNRLWIYTALVGSLFGLASSTYFKSTRIGLWLYAKFDMILDYLVERWGLTWLEQPTDAWRKKYPYVKPKYEPMLDGYSWELKLRDRNGRAKYCTGYESFPRNFKKLIYELDDLFDSEIDF